MRERNWTWTELQALSPLQQGAVYAKATEHQRSVWREEAAVAERREPQTHALKCVQPFFEEAWAGRKPFEVRRDDRDYQTGDVVILTEWDDLGYGDRSCIYRIGFVLRDPRLVRKGFCVFGLLPDNALASVEAPANG